ncbi:unnamed protein product [Darwinula stevensoni]|uniref:Uncharacterized protein n=1 Tax=Darwinula stevensoni TaxID=69355 RepID=A0A7R9A8N9_9CRUS|nr:unnamed protein product [Darwinula stevensoni]CAG0896552.1 unnamed protein product [Darwinula stevensoni]
MLCHPVTQCHPQPPLVIHCHPMPSTATQFYPLPSSTILYLLVICEKEDSFPVQVAVNNLERYRYINIVFFCIHWLAMSNSCCNPFVYAIYNDKFKKEFIQRWGRCRCLRGRRQSPSSHDELSLFDVKIQGDTPTQGRLHDQRQAPKSTKNSVKLSYHRRRMKQGLDGCVPSGRRSPLESTHRTREHPTDSADGTPSKGILVDLVDLERKKLTLGLGDCSLGLFPPPDALGMGQEVRGGQEAKGGIMPDSLLALASWPQPHAPSS